MPDESKQEEHEYHGWKIKITDKAVDTKFSAFIQVWRPGQDPRRSIFDVVPFLKRAASREAAQAAALQEAKKWIDGETEDKS